MNAKLHSLWSILAHDGVGDAIGDARPTFVVSRDGRFLHFANVAGARFLDVAPVRALDARVALEPRIADRLARFVAASSVGDTGRDLIRFFDGLRSTLLSVGFRRLADDAVLITADNARTRTDDADPAASLAAIAAEGGLVALFDGDGDVVAALGDHAALDDVQDDIAAALDADDGAPVFERRVATAGRAHDVALVRLGAGDRARRLLHVGPAVALATTAPAPVAETVAPSTAPAVPPVPVLPEPELPAAALHPEATTDDLARAVAAVTEGTDEADAVAETNDVAPAAAAPLTALDREPEAETTTEDAIDDAEPDTSAEIAERDETDTDVSDVAREASPAALVASTAAAPVDTDVEATTEEEASAAEAPEAPAEGFRYRPAGRAVKFVWQMDAERRFTLISDELAEVVGPTAAAVVGRSWREVADDLGLDRDGRVASALERRDTWSGRTVLWPVEGEALRLPVDLAALPAFDRGRVFTGYRGFGTIRGEEATPDPTATGLRLGAAPLVGGAATATDRDGADHPASASHEAAALAQAPLAAVEAELEPPSYPDDSEVELVAEHDHRPEKPESDDGEAAFAGEIADAPETAPAAVADVAPAGAPTIAAPLPDLWLDDELALAMATLPACGEGDEAAAAETPATDTAPVDEATPAEPAAAVVQSDEAVAATILHDAAAVTAEAETDLETTLTDDPVARFAALPPVSPLALHALDEDGDDLADDEAEDEDHDAETLDAVSGVAAPREDHAPAPAAAASEDHEQDHVAAASEDHEVAHATSRRERLAQAPASLRAAVAEIAERAAELEPRIILPAHDEPTAEPAPAAVVDEATPSASDPIEAPVAEPSQPAPATSEAAAEGTEPPTATQAAPLVGGRPSDGTETAPAQTPAAPRAVSDASSKIVALTAATRPPLDAARLSPPEHVAFRQIAEALGARIEGEEAPAATPKSSTAKKPAAARAETATPAPTTIDTRLLDRLPGAVAVVKDDNLVYGNDAFLRLLGYSDLAALDAAGGLDALFAGEHVARRWDAGPDGARPVPVLAHDGRVIPVDATVSTVPWAGGSALMLTLTEVTPAVAAPLAAAEPTVAPAPLAAPVAETRPAPAAPVAEASLRERVAELEAIIDTATDGVLLLDADGLILSANHTAEALFGADRRTMIGRPLADRLAPESRRSAMDYLDGLARNGVASVLNDGREVIGVVEQGGLIPLFMTIGRLSSEPVRKYCAVLRDITQWKKSEEELTAARRRAEEASVHKSDFLAKISHEIRTPLNAIIGFSEVMMDERFGAIGNDRYKDYLRDIHSSGSHIMSLINDLLDLSKVEAGKMDLRFEAVALGDIMSECVAMMQPHANRERIIIRSSLPAGVPAVVADPRSVRQVMLNLLSNAIKFTPSGGQVIVSTTLEDSGEVVMRVRDTGYGMTDKELQTAMEPFRQLHTTRSRGGGTGLGLPLTKALVEANRAVFRLDSTVGQGTLATVTFPVTRVLAS